MKHKIITKTFLLCLLFSVISMSASQQKALVPKLEKAADRVVGNALKKIKAGLSDVFEDLSDKIADLPTKVVGRTIGNCIIPFIRCEKLMEEYIDGARETDHVKLNQMKKEFWKKEAKFGNTDSLCKILKDDTPGERAWKEKFAKGIASVPKGNETGREANETDLYADLNPVGYLKNTTKAMGLYIWKEAMVGACGRRGWLTGEQALNFYQILNCYRKKKKSD